MIAELESQYLNKYELLRSYVQILLHEGLKIKPADPAIHPGHSSERISHLFYFHTRPGNCELGFEHSQSLDLTFKIFGDPHC